MPELRILLVEDDKHDYQLLLRTLNRSELDCVVTWVADADKALDEVQATDYDLVMTDYHLPGMDGLELLNALDERSFDAPIIFLTGAGSEQVAVEAMQAGAYEYLVKDVQGDYLKLLPTTVSKGYQQWLDKQARLQAEEALREREEQYRDLFESTNDLIFSVNFEGEFLYSNRAWQETMGYTHDNLKDINFEDILLVDYQTEYMEACVQLLRGEPAIDIELILITQNQQALIVEGNLTTRELPDKSINVRGIFRDVTRRKRTEREREELISELNAYVHTVAHDLKSPLTAINLTTSRLLSITEDGQKEILQNRILYSVQKMNNIIDELLLLAQIRSMDEFLLSPVNMRRIVTESVGRLEHQITASKATVNFPETFPVVQGYAPWLEEVWVNYLSNAMKYGGNPPVIDIGADELDDHHVRLWVKDNGAGLTPEQQMKLFTPFTRLDQVRPDGYGLGLSIVKRIVDKLNGDVGVDSTVGEGSVFSFTLPKPIL